MHRECGMTLIETAIVVAIVALLSVIAIPEYLRTLPHRRLKADAMDIASNLKLARSIAARRNINAGVYFYPDRPNYCVFLDGGEPGQFEQPGDGIIKGPVALRTGVNFSRDGNWTVSQNVVSFAPNGLEVRCARDPSSCQAQPEDEIVLSNTARETKTIKVSRLTGQISIP